MHSSAHFDYLKNHLGWWIERGSFGHSTRYYIKKKTPNDFGTVATDDEVAAFKLCLKLLKERDQAMTQWNEHPAYQKFHALLSEQRAMDYQDEYLKELVKQLFCYVEDRLNNVEQVVELLRYLQQQEKQQSANR
jgi:hypothetical protein